MEDYLPEEADIARIEPTPDDIGRYIEERLKQNLDRCAVDEELRAAIRRIIPKKISGM